MLTNKKPLTYIIWGLFPFLFGHCMEFVLFYLIEPIVYGGPVTGAGNQPYIHWMLVWVWWGSVAVILTLCAKKYLGIDVLDARGKIPALNWAVIAVMMIVLVHQSAVSWEGSFKPFHEFKNLGASKFAFQYIYYMFETALITLICVFSQKFGEALGGERNEKFPWCAVQLSLTWGIGHIITQGLLDGMNTALDALLMGVIYYAAKENIFIAFVLLYLSFIV